MKKGILYVPPRPLILYTCFFQLGIVIYLLQQGIELERGYISNTFLLVLSVLLAVYGSCAQILYEDCITNCILFVIPIRRVLWADICSAYFLPIPESQGSPRGNASILLRIGTEREDFLTPEQASRFSRQNPGKTIRINIPKGKEDLYIEAVEKCCGFPFNQNAR